MEIETKSAAWIAVDWGTSNLRAWGMSERGEIILHAASGNGMARLAQGEFEPALLELVADWLAPGQKTVAIACGMVGARQGWIEAPYVKAPCAPLPDKLISAPVTDPLLSLYIIPGIAQENPADVMRGEETQIAGFIGVNPDWDGVICLPGTHSKWVRISAGRIVDFTTFMTGELFSLLSSQSVLRHGVASRGWNDEAFGEALDDIIKKPERIAAQLFSLRAGALIAGLSPQAARARLSGLLIGAELAGARPCWTGQQVALIGANKLYARALATQAISATIYDDRQMGLAGLSMAHNRLKETI